MTGFAILLVASLAAFNVAADTTADIRGMVADPGGEGIGGAIVRLEPLALTDTTDSAGRFTFTGIADGTYLLSAELPGSVYGIARRQVAIPADGLVPMTLTLWPRTYHADEVIVVAPHMADELSSGTTPAQVAVVERSQFEETAVTVADVIEATPSAIITSTGGLGSFSEVSLRGAYSNQVQVFIDGMLLNEAVGGAVNLGTIPLTSVERVEVWRSGAPAGFGGDAAGGSINIVTRDTGTDERSASVGYGSFNTITAHGVAGFGSEQSRLLVTVDAASSENNFEYTSDNGTPQNPDDDYTADRQNDRFRTANMLAKYRAFLGQTMLFEISEHFMRSSKQLPAIQHIGDSDASLTTTRNLLQSRLTWQPGAVPWLAAAPALHTILTREQYRDPSGTVGWGAQDNEYDTRVFSGVVPVTFTVSRWGEFTLTPLTKHESYRPEHKLDVTIPLSSDREQLAISGDVALHTPGRRAVMTAMLRRDRYFSEYEGQANRFSPVSPKPQFHHFTSSRAGIRFALHPRVSLGANYGDLWRAPGFYELFGDRGAVVATPGLKPEHVFKWDAGMRFTIPRSPLVQNGMIEAVYFEHTFRDLIQWYTNNYGFSEPANVAGSYVHGTEIIWSTRHGGLVSWTGSWTFQRSKVTDADHSYHQGRKLPNRPDHYGTSTLEVGRGRLTVFWRLDHKSTYFLDRANQDHRRYPGRTLHDAGMSLRFAEGRMVWRLQVTNIGDKRTFDVLGMPKPGRSVLTALEYRS